MNKSIIRLVLALSAVVAGQAAFAQDATADSARTRRMMDLFMGNLLVVQGWVA